MFRAASTWSRPLLQPSSPTIATGFGPVNTITLPDQTSSITAISETGNLVTATLSAPLNNVPVGYTIVIANVVIPDCSLNSQPPCNPNAYDGAFTVVVE